jgi:hypothetical protein
MISKHGKNRRHSEGAPGWEAFDGIRMVPNPYRRRRKDMKIKE